MVTDINEVRKLKFEMDRKVADLFLRFTEQTGLFVTGFTITNINASSQCGPAVLPGICESQIKL